MGGRCMHEAVRGAMRDPAVSDVHLRSGVPVWVRRWGQMRAVGSSPLETSDVDAVAGMVLGDGRREHLREGRDVDAAWQMPDGDRWRVHAYRARGVPVVTMRRIPRAVPTLQSLGLPASLATLVRGLSGLVLVTGPTGSGKSSTMAALIDGINRERECHVLTLEDPVEFVHAPQRALVTQRELDRDVESLPTALRSAVRADPDVVMVGELRDEATVDAALQLAETGHLTLATLHTRSAMATLHRLIDLTSPTRHAHVRHQLAMVLVGVVSQQLLPRASGAGRVAAVEVMRATPAIRHLLREGKVHQLPAAMQAEGRDGGSWSLSQSLAALVAAGDLTEEAAGVAAGDRDDFRQWLPRERRSESGGRC